MNIRQVVTEKFLRMSARQMENTPNADDLDLVIDEYTRSFSDGLYGAEQIARRFDVWMENNDRWPTPNQIRNMRISDYVPTSNVGQAPAIGNDSRRLPLRSETVSADEYAKEWLAKMRQGIQ